MLLQDRGFGSGFGAVIEGMKGFRLGCKPAAGKLVRNAESVVLVDAARNGAGFDPKERRGGVRRGGFGVTGRRCGAGSARVGRGRRRGGSGQLGVGFAFQRFVDGIFELALGGVAEARLTERITPSLSRTM